MAIWVFAEEMNGAVNRGALELLTKARSFGDVNVLYLGTGSDEAFATLGEYGAAAVYHLDVGDALPSSVGAAAFAELLGAHGGTLILFGAGSNDRDIAGRLAARMNLPVIANALDVEINGAVSVVSEILGGTLSITTESTSDGPALVTTRPKAFAAEPSGGGIPVVTAVPVPDVGRSGSAIIAERHIEASEGPDLESAAVVVTGGRGLGAAENFELMDELAGLLNGAVGGTRAVVDAGWVPYSYQVGQTGKTVKPNVYIACGVSGAMQHVVGMKGASTIIAINKDPDAPIFGIADLGVVGDLHTVVPQLVNALKAR
jgi:electron transfer flavoprotein alpha subunit